MRLDQPQTRLPSAGKWRLTVALVAAGAAAVFSLSEIGSASQAVPSSSRAVVRTASAGAVPAAAPVALRRTSSARPAFTKASSSAVTIKIQSYAFSVPAAKVKVGQTVTWINMDTAPHTVTVSSGPVKFTSPNLQKGDTFSYTFTKAGTYSYYCAVHPDMKATVTVTGTGSTGGSTGGTSGGSSSGGMGGMGGSGGTGTDCTGARVALDTFLQHVYSGHLEEGLGQQVGDISNVDQYAKTHTVLVENLLKPLVGGGEDALNTFLQHVYSGHLEEGLGQQAGDILNLDQYAKTHTVLIENLVAPLVGSEGC
ncbi:MAG TPA: cupredoxin family copper-binding protein [Nocardioides sp.]|nr:cupredoxin family copper-binding protein [Nocardioides sp.]